MAYHATRLLVVDDNDTNRAALVQHLEAEGHDVQTAFDGQAALDIVQTQPFDLVLLGISLPRVSGLEVLEHMKRNPDLQHIPVIIVSAVSSPDSIVRCIQLGADDYIREPISMTLLDNRIRVSLSKKRLREEQQLHLKRVEKLADIMEQVILPMGIALSSETDFERMLERILIEAKGVCNADAGTVYMRTEDDSLRFAIVITESLGIALGGTTGNPVSFPLLPLYDNKTGEPNHHYVVSHVALTGNSINIPDIYEAEGFDFSATRIFDENNSYRSVSSLAVPLKDNNDQVVAVLQLLNAQDQDGNIIPFDEYNQLVVESLSSQAAIILNNHLLLQHEQKLYKLENDIQVARTIQTNFLPSKMPEVPGWEIGARFQPAREVAGDFYDVFPMVDGNKVGFVIADVCDKGVGAALFMALTRSLIRAFSMRNYVYLTTQELPVVKLPNPVDSEETGAGILKTAVVNTNEYITEHHLDLIMFATLFFGVLDPSTGSLLYINGGHCPPLIVSPTGDIKARLDTGGPAVGMFPGAEFMVQQAQLESGDILLAFTDGVTDVRNPTGEFFGEESLIELLTPAQSSATALVDRIYTALSNHMADAVQFDDITMLALGRTR